MPIITELKGFGQRMVSFTEYTDEFQDIMKIIFYIHMGIYILIGAIGFVAGGTIDMAFVRWFVILMMHLAGLYMIYKLSFKS